MRIKKFLRILKQLEIKIHLSKVKGCSGLFSRYRKRWIFFGLDYDGILDYYGGWQKRIDIILFNFIIVTEVFY
jgi:hypothetical protein